MQTHCWTRLVSSYDSSVKKNTGHSINIWIIAGRRKRIERSRCFLHSWKQVEVEGTWDFESLCLGVPSCFQFISYVIVGNHSLRLVKYRKFVLPDTQAMWKIKYVKFLWMLMQCDYYLFKDSVVFVGAHVTDWFQ